MRRNFIIAFVIGLAVVAVMCIIGALIGVRVFSAPVVRPGPVELQDLLIDSSVLPQGWQLVRGPVPVTEKLKYGSEENLSAVFKGPKPVGAVEHEIYRYTNPLKAMFYFGISADISPNGLKYRSPLAGQFEIECSDLEIDTPLDPSIKKITNCTARARYEEYISVLQVGVGPGMLSSTDVERILQAIDARMAKYLKTQVH
jgi:hypothetical protein